MHFDDVRKRLRTPFRVALAHGDPKGGTPPRTYASAEDYRAVAVHVPIIRFMAHVTIQNVRVAVATERLRLIRELCVLLASRKTVTDSGSPLSNRDHGRLDPEIGLD
jgi:hypothetical protein